MSSLGTSFIGPLPTGIQAPLRVIGSELVRTGGAIERIGDEMVASRRRTNGAKNESTMRQTIEQLNQAVADEQNPQTKIQLMDQGLEAFRKSLEPIKDVVEREAAINSFERMSAFAKNSTLRQSRAAQIDDERASTLQVIDDLERARAAASDETEQAAINIQIGQTIQTSGRAFSKTERLALLRASREKRERFGVEAMQGNINTVIDEMLGSPDGVNSETLAIVVQDEIDSRVRGGMDKSLAVRSAIQSITRAAAEAEDETILEALAQIITAEGPIGQTQFGRDERNRAEGIIIQRTLARDKISYANQGRMRKLREDNAAQGAIQHMLSGNDLRELLPELNRISPELGGKMLAFESALASSDERISTDRAVFADILFKINTDPHSLSPTIISDAVVNRQITPSAATTLSTGWRIARDRRSDPRSDDRVVKAFHDRVFRSIRGNDFDFTNVAAFKASTASGEYWQALDDFIAANPKATMTMVRREMDDVSKRLTFKYSPDIREDLNLGKSDPITSTGVTQLDSSQVRWKQQAMFKDVVELQSVLEEYNAAQGKSGRLADIFIQLRFSEADKQLFLNAQEDLVKRGSR